MRENYKRNGGSLQNYSYLSCHYLQTSKLSTLLSLENFVLFCYLVSKLSYLKKACMLMKPLVMKAKLAEK